MEDVAKTFAVVGLACDLTGAVLLALEVIRRTRAANRLRESFVSMNNFSLPPGFSENFQRAHSELQRAQAKERSKLHEEELRNLEKGLYGFWALVLGFSLQLVAVLLS